MRKYIIVAFWAVLLSTSAFAQSSMTDNQVMEFVQKEVKVGTSQQQIVTKLMQKGVDINQIRRVRKKYQRQMNETGLGNVNEKTTGERLRSNNADGKLTDADKALLKRQTEQDVRRRSTINSS